MEKKKIVIIIKSVTLTDKNKICWKIEHPKDCDEIEFFKNIEEQLFGK